MSKLSWKCDGQMREGEQSFLCGLDKRRLSRTIGTWICSSLTHRDPFRREYSLSETKNMESRCWADFANG